jgi:hypothetical protein
MADQDESQNGRKPMIVGGAKERPADEMDEITQMIEEAQHSSRARYIPAEDLDARATTQMSPHVAEIVAASKVDVILQKFNRDYLYGMGRFDEYAGGLLLKWGDGYSRKHIWVTVDGDNLLFQTSHERKCSKDYCVGGQHVFTPEMWHDVRQINAELAEQFQRPVQERTDD